MLHGSPAQVCAGFNTGLLRGPLATCGLLTCHLRATYQLRATYGHLRAAYMPLTCRLHAAQATCELTGPSWAFAPLTSLYRAIREPLAGLWLLRAFCGPGLGVRATRACLTNAAPFRLTKKRGPDKPWIGLNSHESLLKDRVDAKTCLHRIAKPQPFLTLQASHLLFPETSPHMCLTCHSPATHQPNRNLLYDRGTRFTGT